MTKKEIKKETEKDTQKEKGTMEEIGIETDKAPWKESEREIERQTVEKKQKRLINL